jgi:hypothetical protein
MKNRLLQFAGVLAILAVLGKFYAVPLIAQIRAALVKNVDEPGRSPYQQGTQCSSSNGGCDAIFAAVPGNKRLVLQTVSAQAQVLPAAAELLDFYLNDGSQLNVGFFPPRLYLNPVVMTRFSNNFEAIYNFSAKTDHFFEPGTTPRLTIFVADSNTVILSATLTGYLIDLTQ